ncbi:MAG: hypothetical protein WBD31_03820, partial [Rubripirellula sp.]
MAIIAIAATLGPHQQVASADDGLKRQSSWNRFDAASMAQMLRSSMDEFGVTPDMMDRAADDFLNAIESDDADPLDAFVKITSPMIPVIGELVSVSNQNVSVAAASVDPSTPTY